MRNIIGKTENRNKKREKIKINLIYMAKVVYIEPIESISGKLFKKSKVVFMVRKAATSNSGNKNYTHSVGVRSTRPSENELAQRAKFAQICKAVSTRLTDGTQMAKDQAAFKQQTTYKTLRQFVWHQVSDSME